MEVLVQQVNVPMNYLQYNKLIVIVVYTKAEVEAGISLVDNLCVLVFQEVTHSGLSGQYHRHQIPVNSLLIFGRHGVIPVLEAAFAVTAE